MAHSGQYDMQEVVVRTTAGTLHRATLNLITDTLLTPESCNLDDADSLETLQGIPEEAQGIDLCQRCYPTGSDR